MRPFLFRSFAAFISTAILALTAGSVFAQPQYRVEYGYFPPDTEWIEFTDLAEARDGNGPVELIAVGALRNSTWSRDGFIYNYSTGILVEMHTLLNPNDGWTSSKFFGVNSNGIVVGSVSNDNANTRLGVWLDVFAPIPELHFLEDSFAELQGTNHIAKQVNSGGDMLIIPYDSAGGGVMISPQFLVNPFTAEEPIQWGDFYAQAVNDNRVIVGNTTILPWLRSSNSSVVRFDANTGDRQIFPQYEQVDDINNQDQFCGSTSVQIRRNKWKRYAFGHRGVDPNVSAEWTSDPVEVLGETSQNNQGDVVGRTYSNGNKTFFYHSGLDQIFRLDELVSDSFLNTGDQVGQHLTDHDFSLATPSPIIAGSVQGSNGEPRLFFLVPDVPGPGISVSPTNGLVTTEGGATGSFTVVLDTQPQPTDDVTIGISVSPSGTGEGTVDTQSLNFTSDNWDTPQTVTITGQGDGLPDEDGDVAYTIVTAPAVSDDLDYKELDAEDVQVTNLDPSSGGSETYSSNDTPKNIRDRKNTFSTISIGDDYGIAGMTVNLDISHNRPSDLSATLIGPDGTETPLLNFSGNNDVIAFNDTSSLGDWTLKVRDNNRGETGTLNGWSITVDY